MKKLEIYEPAMCCSTGVCGVDVDPVLVQFVGDLQWLAEQGVEVARHNLSQEPQAFASNRDVVKEMEAGSVLTINTRRPDSARAMPVAHDSEVLPTPPLPVKNR